MIEFRLSPGLLGHTRFVFSPLAEVGASLRLLGMPQSNHPHQRWAHRVRPRLSSTVDIDLLTAVCPPSRCPPDFFFAPSGDHVVTIGDQLEQMRHYPPSRFAEDLSLAWAGRPRPRVVGSLLADPAGAIPRVVDQLAAYWTVGIAPYWSRICAVLEDDVSYRASRSVSGGLYELLLDIHPEITIRGSRLIIDKPAHCDELLDGDVLILTPCVFLYPSLVLSHDSAGRFCATYTARGVGRVWEHDAYVASDRGEPVAALLGPTRARVLRAIDVPMSTTRIARELALTPSSVSQHLSVLRDSGLVHSWRSGREVHYRQTELAASFLATNGRSTAASGA